ncbi:hypothetical protein KP509_19G017400 [Ceratopteris richardii]|uniref:Probable RNA polymerase II nuclear localization protein SLC7A6OS n=1 Tax=Ceratopteris richardii TaxID=49495 RepID=A0A8T2SI56_CERRI|nr:hypothetical protein KP509_19G017400 [Ceratopteris richardii]
MAEEGSGHASSRSVAAAADDEGNTSKPLIVRVKRKRSQLPIEALWLEVSERPTKRLEEELRSFSFFNSGVKGPEIEEVKSSRLFFHHVDTITSFGTEETTRVNLLLREFHSESNKDRHRPWVKSKEGRFSTTTSREKHEETARKARFEQVWRSRKGFTKPDNLSEIFQLYDIVRVDLDTDSLDRKEREAELTEKRLLQDFLPLFKEYIPSVAAEIESSSESSPKKEEGTGDDYVFDLYALGSKAGGDVSPDMGEYPMIQVVDDDDFMWGQSSDSEHDSEDSNDENNPLNDYPEEEEDSTYSTDAEDNASEVSAKRRYMGRTVSSDFGSDPAEGYGSWDDDHDYEESR